MALQDQSAVHALLQDVDAVVHLGGVSVEGPFEPILQANIIGMHHLYEAARKHGVKRIVFASSNHVTGFYRQDEVIDARMPMRPDGHYGLSKAFGENLAQFYFDRYGLETVSLRIGSSFPEPKDRRMLATWMSYDDLERLVVSSLTAPVVGHTVIYGASDNTTSWWDNTPARHIGYRPQDSSERFRATVEARQQTLDRNDPATLYQGGGFELLAQVLDGHDVGVAGGVHVGGFEYRLCVRRQRGGQGRARGDQCSADHHACLQCCSERARDAPGVSHS